MSRRLHRCVAVLLGLALAVVGLSMAAAADDEHGHNGHGRGVDKVDDPAEPVMLVACEPDLSHTIGLDRGAGFEQLEVCPEYRAGR